MIRDEYKISKDSYLSTNSNDNNDNNDNGGADSSSSNNNNNDNNNDKSIKQNEVDGALLDELGRRIITIDGPASSGKGSVAKKVAQLLGFNYLDSGAVYRALAYLVAIKHNIVKYDAIVMGATLILDNDIKSIVKLINSAMHLSFIENKQHQTRVILNHEDVTAALRDERIGILASILAKNGLIREGLLKFQHDFAKPDCGLVTDGRDMGSVVFPYACLKIFLTAKAQVRAKRRYLELQASGKSVKIEAILRDIMLRDEQDSRRKTAPLKYDSTYKVLDNSDLTIDDTAACIIQWFNQIKRVHG